MYFKSNSKNQTLGNYTSGRDIWRRKWQSALSHVRDICTGAQALLIYGCVCMCVKSSRTARPRNDLANEVTSKHQSHRGFGDSESLPMTFQYAK